MKSIIDLHWDRKALVNVLALSEEEKIKLSQTVKDTSTLQQLAEDPNISIETKVGLLNNRSTPIEVVVEVYNSLTEEDKPRAASEVSNRQFIERLATAPVNFDIKWGLAHNSNISGDNAFKILSNTRDKQEYKYLKDLFVELGLPIENITEKGESKERVDTPDVGGVEGALQNPNTSLRALGDIINKLKGSESKIKALNIVENTQFLQHILDNYIKYTAMRKGLIFNPSLDNNQRIVIFKATTDMEEFLEYEEYFKNDKRFYNRLEKLLNRMYAK